MSRDIVNAAQGSYRHAISLFDRFVEVCPDAVWNEKSGGWPVWQHMVHVLTAMDFFVRDEGEEPIPCPVDADTGRLVRVAEGSPLSRESLNTYALAVKARADAFIQALTDADLAMKREAVSKGMGRDMSNVAVLGLLADHIFYHLGYGDAALRNNGLAGVF